MPLIGSFGASSARGFGRGGGRVPYFVDFLIMGGGGSGGFYQGAGGGGGGMVTGTNKQLTIGETYTITVGAPGPVDGPEPYHQGGSGGNSSLTGETTAVGGGGGGGGYGGAGGRGGFPGLPGGSGGGGGGQGVPPQPGGSGTPGQGFSGGDGGGPQWNDGGGTGGGAGSIGSPRTGGSGGAGSPSSITGTNIYYGAGGTFNQPSGIGPARQGGMPAGPYSPAWDSQKVDPVYFGGRGTGGNPDKYPGALGGVYLRMETKNYNPAGVTGTHTTYTDGDYTIIQFTGSGSYEA